MNPITMLLGDDYELKITRATGKTLMVEVWNNKEILVSLHFEDGRLMGNKAYPKDVDILKGKLRGKEQNVWTFLPAHDVCIAKTKDEAVEVFKAKHYGCCKVDPNDVITVEEWLTRKLVIEE